MNDLAPLHDFHVRDTVHQYTYDATYGLWEIRIAPASGVGWFRHSLRSVGGQLYFRRGALVAVDGSLPGDVRLGLLKVGFLVPDVL